MLGFSPLWINIFRYLIFVIWFLMRFVVITKFKMSFKLAYGMRPRGGGGGGGEGALAGRPCTDA